MAQQAPEEAPHVAVLDHRSAEGHAAVLGYVYAAIEPQSWKELRDEAGFIHDVLVDESARNAGVAKALLDAAIAWLGDRRVPRVVLWTAHANGPARPLLTGLGYRPTIIEMTKEITVPPGWQSS